MDSSQNTESVDALNQLLQGEYMAVESFNTFIAKVAIEGETKGVNMAEKVLRGNLDDKSRDIAGEILNKDRASIKRLMKLTES